MDSLVLSDVLLALLPSSSFGSAASIPPIRRGILPAPRPAVSRRTITSGLTASSRPSAVGRTGALMANSMSQSYGVYTVGDFMTKREELQVVKPATPVEEALEMLVEHKVKGFPVINDDWTLVGVVSDFDLLALDSISGSGQTDTSMFPEVGSTWKTFREIQKLLGKTNGKVVGDVMTTSPLVVRETTNLEDVARLLLETKYRRFPVVDSTGKLIGIITRGNVIKAALQIKHASEKSSQV